MEEKDAQRIIGIACVLPGKFCASLCMRKILLRNGTVSNLLFPLWTVIGRKIDHSVAEPFPLSWLKLHWARVKVCTGFISFFQLMDPKEI